MKQSSLLFFLFLITKSGLVGQNTEIQYLSGLDKDRTVQWDFFCTSGMNSGKWSSIAVPSNWELQGFGSYLYGNVNLKADEKGLYRYEFTVPAGWKRKRVNIVFEGSMTDTEVKINGRSAGPIHQGGFYRFSYDISELLDFRGKNLLEVTVSKESADESVNRAERMADYWVFGGIYRPVYLEALPEQHIERVAIDARSDGSFNMEVFVAGKGKAKTVEAKILTPAGEVIGFPLTARVNKDSSGMSIVSGSFTDVLTWHPETPYLYEVNVSILNGRDVIHQISEKFGFRTVEVRQGDGIYVNGIRIMFKGVCRHTFWPSSGRTSSLLLAIEDVNLMKDMNMNAVRMSHYPPDEYFLDVCDSLGLFVLDELAGWQKSYDTPTAKRLVKQMVIRDVNHPCVIMWDNGNEGGFNRDARDEFARYDPQKRPVIEPWSILNGINTKHYPGYYNAEDALAGRQEIYFPTEFLHGLNDGGLGAGLDDYWELMTSARLSAGGFLWAFADEGIERRDMNDSIDTAGNLGPDGILGPYHEKEGSFYTIKEIWSPIVFKDMDLPEQFDGSLEIENRYDRTNLDQCRFSYKLERYSFPEGISGETTGNIDPPDIPPGENGLLRIELPSGWREYDVIYITAYDKAGREINTWTWRISDAPSFALRNIYGSSEKIRISEKGNMLVVRSGRTDIIFNKKNGSLAGAGSFSRQISISGDSLFTGFENDFVRMRHYNSEEGYVVDARYTNAHAVWTVLNNGWLKLDYSFTLKGPYNFAGITLSYPEEMVTGVRMIADGPYRVWKNRMKGTRFGLYDKMYNNTVTGQSYVYPEFKGYYSGFYAAGIQTLEAPITIVNATDNIFLHLFTPSKATNLEGVNGSVSPPFPGGNISLLHGIPPIGTKFSSPVQEGPQGRMNEFSGTMKGTVFFRFGE